MSQINENNNSKTYESNHGLAKIFKNYKKLIFSHPELLMGLILTILIILSSAFVPIFHAINKDFDPLKMSGEILKPPFVSLKHFLGTDQFGRDVLIRLLHGSRISLSIAWISVIGAAILGASLGSISGYYGGYLDVVIMRIVEAVMTIPLIILALLLSTVFNPGPNTLIFIFIFASMPIFAKVIRGVVLSIKEEEYILAAKAGGSTNIRIIFKHILPNYVNQVFILITLQLSRILFVEAGLSFLGVGVQVPNPSWGNMLAEGRNYMMVAWWLAIFPGVALLMTILGVNLVTDGLQEVLDPRSKKMRNILSKG